MAFINWSEKFSVNVKEIDEEHKRLIHMLNTLHAAFLEKKGQEAQKAIVLEMVDYATYHFATEEKYMLHYQYPGYAAHKKEHDAFTEKALDIKARVERSGSIFTLELINFLKEWLQNHIMGTDKEYSSFFNAHGLY